MTEEERRMDSWDRKMCAWVFGEKKIKGYQPLSTEDARKLVESVKPVTEDDKDLAGQVEKIAQTMKERGYEDLNVVLKNGDEYEAVFQNENSLLRLGGKW